MVRPCPSLHASHFRWLTSGCRMPRRCRLRREHSRLYLSIPHPRARPHVHPLLLLGCLLSRCGLPWMSLFFSCASAFRPLRRAVLSLSFVSLTDGSPLFVSGTSVAITAVSAPASRARRRGSRNCRPLPVRVSRRPSVCPLSSVAPK